MQRRIHSFLTQRNLQWLWLGLACAVLLLPRLSYPLIEPDETRYVEIAIEMHQSGDWVTPTLSGVPYLDKPPLLYWLTTLSFSVLGENEFAARIPSVFAAIATVLITFGFGRRLIGDRAAWIGSVSLLLSGGFILAGRFVILDALLTFLVVGCLLSGLIAVGGSNFDRRWWCVSCVLCALGGLTKGPVAMVLCMPPLIYAGWSGGLSLRQQLRMWSVFVGASVAVCLPWYIAVWQANESFGDHFFWEHNLKRFSQGSNHRQPFWFYLPVLLVGMFPASMLVPVLGVYVYRRSEDQQSAPPPLFHALCVSATWIVGFFSLASCKLPTYILPAMPILCLAIGVMLDRTVFNPESSHRLAVFLKPFPQRSNLVMGLVGLVGVALDGWLHRQVGWVTVTALAGSITCLAATAWFWKDDRLRSWRSWGYTAVASAACLCFVFSYLLPSLACYRSVTYQAANLCQPDSNRYVVFLGEAPHAAELTLRADRIAHFASGQSDQLGKFLSDHEGAIVVARQHDVADLIQSRALESSTAHKRIFIARGLVKMTNNSLSQRSRTQR